MSSAKRKLSSKSPAFSLKRMSSTVIRVLAQQRIRRHGRQDTLGDVVPPKEVKTQLVTTQLRTQQGLTDTGHREGAPTC